jgi:peptidyl-prolyl cis-trans isomerase A (cyclophilin A)
MDTPALPRRAALALGAAALLLGAAACARAPAAPPRVKLVTTLGDVVLELDPVKAPRTVANFLQYVRDRHYDGTVFHRVIDGFMIQGGGLTVELVPKPTRAPVPNEAANGLKNERYTVAMARTGAPDSATAQFFINVRDNPNLDAPRPDGHGYAVFGRVVAGTDVIDRIRAAPTGLVGRMPDVPLQPIVILSASVVER